jgi:hypothetical protein
VEKKCDPSNDEILSEYRETAEATCLMVPAPVKDHGASALAVENQPKTLKIPDSYDCEPEKLCISCDPVEWIILLSNL